MKLRLQSSFPLDVKLYDSKLELKDGYQTVILAGRMVNSSGAVVSRGNAVHILYELKPEDYVDVKSLKGSVSLGVNATLLGFPFYHLYQKDSDSFF